MSEIQMLFGNLVRVRVPLEYPLCQWRQGCIQPATHLCWGPCDSPHDSALFCEWHTVVQKIVSMMSGVARCTECEFSAESFRYCRLESTRVWEPWWHQWRDSQNEAP